jgi:hypothetical protein
MGVRSSLALTLRVATALTAASPRAAACGSSVAIAAEGTTYATMIQLAKGYWACGSDPHGCSYLTTTPA